MKKWLYLIADFSYGEEKLREALQAGVDYIQLREKEISSAEYLFRAKKLREMTAEYGTKLIINDRIDIALLSHADGVHLGQSDVPVQEARMLLGEKLIIGATAKTPKQAETAMQSGADYIGSGAWFETRTKKDALPITVETYMAIKKAAPIPNVAVGGITLENAGIPMKCGADGLAVSAGILAAESVTEQIKKFHSLLNNWEDKE
ncbi:MAG: thiamine phosphate synthase [Lachnospiraceae bacterium]